MNITFNRIILVISLGMSLSCNKFLDKIPNKSLAIPSSLDDYWALLDADEMMAGGTPALNNMGTDDYYFTTSGWLSANVIVRNAYIWNKDIYEGQSVTDWNNPYNNILTANVVLDGLANISINDANRINYNALKGSALFFRAFFHYWLEETFGVPYHSSSAQTDLGIPLRLTSNLNDKSQRSTVAVCYEQIIADLQEAKLLVPENVQSNRRNRPSRAAVYAMLARVYLTMQDFSSAGEYADSCLDIYNSLVDYNTVSASARLPFSNSGNDEVIFMSSDYGGYGFAFSTNTLVDSTLYNSYALDDLRRTVFFRSGALTNSYSFKGHYSGRSYPFSGLAVDEVMLIKSEVAARKGNVSEAMAGLNQLLKTRWSNTATFIPLAAESENDALKTVLEERRKELLFRGLRWIDLKRLNQEKDFAITLQRSVNDAYYGLSPNSSRYTYPIPEDEIRLSGIQQNDR